MGQEQVPFPHDSPNWPLVRDLLTELQERLLNETINAQDAAMHIQVLYEACQAPQLLDERWIQREHGTSSKGARKKLDQSYLWFGMLKFLKKVDRDEKEKFLFTTLPNIIELALRVEEYMPPGRLCFSQQQKGGKTVLSRQFIASILACSFLCLFPERIRDRTSKLNIINFTNFYKQLPQSSQIAKMRCFLHYFERTMEAGLERQGSIAFYRQVADRSMLPTLDDLIKSETALCSFVVHTEGVLEDVGSCAIQVDFANRSIGGGVLGRGRVQEEIRFSTCPELMAAMLFMENMEDNEAILIMGFEQFSSCTGYAASLEFAGPFYDKAQRDPSGNLLNTVCAIDATSFRCCGRQEQYQDKFVLRELHKALVGFSRMESQDPVRLHSVEQRILSEWEEDFVSASESMEEEQRARSEIQHMAEVLAKSLLSQGMVESVRTLTHDKDADNVSQSREEVERLHLGDVSPLSASSDNPIIGQSSSTPRDEAGHVSQVPRDEAGHMSSLGGNGERLALPVIVPRPQNGSCDLLEVDYSEWLANFRRRSSQLSDLTSRRSSSSTKHSSEFSSDLEEIYETLVQAEKAQHGIIEEESYGAALSEYAAHFVTSLMTEGTSVAAQMLPGMKEFQQGQPPAGTLKPQVVRPTAVHFDGENEYLDIVPPTEEKNFPQSELRPDDNLDISEVGDNSLTDISIHFSGERVSPLLQAYVDSLVDIEIKNGVAEAASCIQKTHDDQNDTIPDDVYRWFADKIVQEVFAHVVDELYFQRFTSDSRWRADMPVNREGVHQRHDQSDTDSVSSSSSSSETRRSSSDLQRNQRGSSDLAINVGVSQGSPQLQTKSSYQMGLSSPKSEFADQRSVRRKAHTRRTLSQSSDSEGIEPRERREERKSVTFTMDENRRQSETSRSNVSDSFRDGSKSSRSSGTQSVYAGAKASESTASHWFVVKDIPVPFTTATSVNRPHSSSRSKEISSSRSAKDISRPRPGMSGLGSVSSGGLVESSASGGVVRPRSLLTNQRDVRKPSSSSSFTATSSIPTSLSKATESPSHTRNTSRQTISTLCDTSSQPADSKSLPRPDLPFKDPQPGAVLFHSSLRRQQSSSSEENMSVPSFPSAFHFAQSAEESPSTVQVTSPSASHGLTDPSATSEQGASSGLSSQDLNLDCYRAAAAIVNQVFQSLPDHLSESELQSLRGSPSSFYYHGRKYESIFPRGSYETAAAVIGASEKGNVVSESYIQNKAVTGISTSETTSPRRTRSQSPCFSWLSKRLSRETLTNAFVKVESRQSVKTYERRSSEPCQRSVTLSLQAFNTSVYGYGGDRAEEKHCKNARTDDDLDKVKAHSWRRGSLDSISLSRRRSSCGFKDPVLSRFAQELITADTSVPQLFLVGSGSTTSTTGSRRSSMSGFRDTTLATFESELLNSSFTLSQAPTSPRHRRPKRSHSRESRLWKSDSSETEYWFPIPRRVGQEFQEQLERVHRHYSVDEIEDYADFIATTILQQAVSILYQDMEEMTQEEQDISIFSENLADQILREALVASAKILSTAGGGPKHRSRRVGKAKSVSDSELDFSVSSNDLTTRSLEDRLTDFQDALDVSYNNVELYAGNLADLILASVYEELESPMQRLMPGSQAIATGNWGCGAFCGDPCLKVALQWMAASLAQSPQLLYFTFGDQRLQQLPAVVEMLSCQQWTVGQLMEAVRAYCSLVLDEAELYGGEEGGAAAPVSFRRVAGDGFRPTQTLFEFLLLQP